MYTERKQPGMGAYDFTLGDLTCDDTWRDLDLSAIVPATANAVHIHTRGIVTTVDINSVMLMRGAGITHATATCKLRPQVAAVSIAALPILGVDTTRIVQYKALPGSWTTLNITVLGWWT